VGAFVRSSAGTCTQSIDLGAHDAHPLATRFGRDVAGLARALMKV
jgi:hypothetical protein